MPAIHMEFTEYYYPDGKDFPSKTFFFFVPNHKFCVTFTFVKLSNTDSGLAIQNR